MRPPLRFRLNRKSPLANKLVFFATWLDGNPCPVDLVKGRKATITTTNVPYKVESGSIGGKVARIGTGGTTYSQEVMNWGVYPAEMNGATNASLAVWFRQLEANTSLLIGTQDSNNNGEGLCVEHWEDGNYYFQATADSGTTAVSYANNDLDWHLVTLTYNGTVSEPKARGYVDGRQVVQSVSGFPTALGTFTTNWHLYANNFESSENNNQLAYIALWNKTLTPAEVMRLYEPKTRWELLEPIQTGQSLEASREFYSIGGL